MQDRPHRRKGRLIGFAVVLAVVAALLAVTVLARIFPSGHATVAAATCTAVGPGQLTTAPASTASTPTTTSPAFRDNDVGHARIPDSYADGDIDNVIVHRVCRL